MCVCVTLSRQASTYRGMTLSTTSYRVRDSSKHRSISPSHQVLLCRPLMATRLQSGTTLAERNLKYRHGSQRTRQKGKRALFAKSAGHRWLFSSRSTLAMIARRGCTETDDFRQTRQTTWTRGPVNAQAQFKPLESLPFFSFHPQFPHDLCQSTGSHMLRLADQSTGHTCTEGRV